MPIDPCADGCLNHNIGSNDVPNAGDDPCDTNGNGAYCAGSYWSYDPTAPGADTATNGDCPRLFLRTGDDCVTDQWIELCLKDQLEHLVINAVPDFVNINIPDGTPIGTTINLGNAVIPVTNPSCLPMDVCIRARVWATVRNYETHPNPGNQMTHDITLTVDFGTGAQFAHSISSVNDLSTPSLITAHSNNVGEIEHCFTIPANSTQNVTFDINYNCNGLTPCPESDYFGYGYTIEGHSQT